MALAMVRLVDGTAAALDTARPHALALQLAVIDEVFAHASEEQASSFFVAVGERLASGLALPSDDRLAALELAINAVWQRLGLGNVALAVDDGGIVIDHADYAAAGPANSSTWPKAAAGVVLGAYTAWFRSLSGETPLHTRLVQQTAERIVIHHGL